jgi:hypothetical protein
VLSACDRPSYFFFLALAFLALPLAFLAFAFFFAAMFDPSFE